MKIPGKSNDGSLDDYRSSVSMSNSPFKAIQFIKEASSLKTTAVDGSSVTVKISVDVLTLKIFALLMCKGTIKTKATYLFDIIVGMEKVKKQRQNEENAGIA